MAVAVQSAPQILHAIVGTAGHVDHGKTSLVKMLTGCDTDRLPEEKSRGMSIDLGFAPCLLHGRRLVGIVDVPGHKDFIRNMVAGAASIDVLLLVVAADDGVMPQTDEHMKIVKLLREPFVLVALTKIDMVTPDALELARADVAEFLQRVGFGGSPIILVSNKTGAGVAQIRETIDELVERVRQRQPDHRAFRMNIERVFSVKGYGTVLAGIPISGEIHVGERLELLPGGQQLTVRTIQSYKHECDSAQANCCCAINVREIDASSVARGMTVARPGIYRATRELICSVVNSASQRFERRFEARLHVGTAVVDASIKVLSGEPIPPRGEALAHCALEEPVAIAAGDRFLLRAASPAETIGGGVVLSARPQRLRRGNADLRRFELAFQAAIGGEVLHAELLAGPDAILPAADVARLTQQPPDGAAITIAASIKAGLLTDLECGAYGVVFRAAESGARIVAALDRYHRAKPLSLGMPPANVCAQLGLNSRGFDAAARFLAGGQVPLRVSHGRLALASFRPAVSERLIQLRDRILAQIGAAGVNGPARGNLMKELSIQEREMQLLTRLLTEDETVIVLDGNYVLRGVYEGCRTKAIELLGQRPILDLGIFRDAIGANRKMAVAMLDAFDAEGLTRRVPEGRVLVKHASEGART